MKEYIKVNATFDSGGNLLPEYIVWKSEKKYPIEKISDIRYTASPDKSKPEIRYTCVISGKERFLYFDESRWFVYTNNSCQNTTRPR